MHAEIRFKAKKKVIDEKLFNTSMNQRYRDNLYRKFKCHIAK